MRISQVRQGKKMDNEHNKKEQQDLKAMVFSDGSLVLHNVVRGFIIEVHDSELGEAKPIEIDDKELEKIRKADLKKVKVEDGKVKDKEGKKNDSKDVSSPVQDL